MSGPWEEFSKPAADDGPWNEFSNGDAKKQNKGIVGDLATDLKRGVQNIPGILSGIGDMVVAPVVGDAIVGKGWDLAGKKTGFQPSKWAKEATAEYSDQRKAGNESVEKAWEDNSTPFKDAASGDFSGLGNVAKAYASNPGVVAGSVAESAPSMILGGAIGRGVNVVSKMSPIASAWIGEGSVAGSQQMNDAIENGVDARTASAAAWGTALGVGALGAGGGKIAKRFGLADIDTALAGGSFRGVAKETADATLKGSVKEAAKRIAGGAVSEGVFEELPQSALEQTLSNLAQGKPWDDGIARASVEGTLAGSLMGGAFNAIPGRKPESAPSTDTVVDNKPAIAGLLPSPTYTGTPGGQLVASSAERQAAIDKAQSDSDAIWAARDEYERQQEGYRQRPTPTIITDPEPIQHRINALMGIDEGRLSDKARADYEKAIENAFNEKIGVVVGENSLEIPFTMGDYLQSKVAAADISRDKPKAESANQQSVNRLDQLSSEESQQQPDIPVVGTLSRIANLGIRSGVIQRQGVSAVTQQVAPIAAQVQASPVLAETPQIDLRQRTDGQISYLANNGKPGFREAAIAEIQRRGKTNAAKAQPLAQEATQANDAQAGFEQAAAQKAEGLAPAKLSIPPEIVSRVAKRTDNELAFMGKVNRDPVVREAIALEVAMRAADSGRINEQQAEARLPDATAGESRPAPAADQNRIKKAGPQNRDDLVGAILRVTGSKGIHPKMAQTIVGDKANAATKVRGLFTLRGQQDLDDLAELLRTEEGYDVRDGNHLSNLIREQAAGNPVYSMERTERDAAENEAKKYRAEIRSRAAGLGIKTVAQKFDDIERDVLEAETKQAQDEAAAEREAIQAEQSFAELDDDQLNVLLELAAREANGVEINEQWITNEQILDAFEPIGEEDQDEQGAARAGEAVAGEAGGNRQGRGGEARFDLAGQTNDQAAEQFAQQKAAQEKEAADKNAANNKSKADAEANDFRLAGSDRAADVAIAGGQTGLFTADGRVSVGAKPAEQTVPAWHTSLPTNGLPITADQRKPGGYSRVPNVLADEAYAAITQNQLMNGMPMYAYYLPAANGMNGIVRLIPDDQNAAKPWVLLNGEAIRPAGQTKEQVIAKLAGWLRSAPVLGDEKAEAKPTDLPKNQQNLSTSPEPVKETAKNDDWLGELFGQQALTPSSDPAKPKTEMSEQEKADRVDVAIAMLTGEIDANDAAAAELAARKYKTNRKQIELAGDGPGKNGSMSVSAINESRRRRAIEASLNASASIKRAIEFISEYPDSAFRQVLDMERAVTKQFNEGFFGPSAKLDSQLDMAVGSMIESGSYSGEGSAGRKLRMAAHVYFADPKPADDGKPDIKADAIGDFGEKIGGAKKDLWTGYKDKLSDAESLDIKAEPLSKSWPAPDYEALIESGVDSFVVAFIRSARDSIPRKPTATWKVKSWAGGVELLRDTSKKLIEGELSATQAKDLLRKAGSVSHGMRDISGRIELYQLVGHRQSLDGISLSNHFYSLYKGKENVDLWAVEKEAKATAFSNMPAEIVTGATKQEVLDKFKALYDKVDFNRKADRAVSFDLYSQAGKFYVGKKMGRNITQLAGPFDTVKEVRAYRDDHYDELVAKLDKAKEIPKVRRDSNNPRVGEDMRDGQDVTPEIFADAFGFKGVEFGNWVEQKKRQKDLNESFDALMDMAAILNIPPKALSLNGQLGLAFGARGAGGIDPAAAHYERDFVVINLTKKEGAGSLGHEWFHALDNYFSRLRGKGSDLITEALDVSLAGRGSDFIANTAVRKEMIQAFGRVVNSIKMTALRERSSKLDNKRSKAYWTTTPEMSARAFESYLISKLQDQNASNDYLANIVDDQTWKAAESLGFELDDSYPYPTAGEMPLIREAFDKFFQTVETKETDSGVMLYNIADDEAPIEKEGKRWGATVDDFFAGKISKSESPVILRSTPASLQALGLPDYEIRTSLTHGVEAAMFNHGIKPSQLKAIPLAMADPQAIFVNQGADGKYSLNVLTGMFVNGKQIAIALQPSKYGVSSGPVHFVATITPRENGVFAKMAENGQLVYAGSNIPDDVKRGLNKAKMKYGQSAIDLKALIASKFVSTARTSKVVYKSDLVNLIKSGQAQFSADGDVKISPADKAIYGMAAEGKSASEILKFIASASRSPFNRQVAKLLLKTGINPTITVGDGKGWKMNAGDGHKYAAAYNPGTDTVALFRPASAERHALHELIHAATIKALSKKGLAAVQMRALFAHVQKNGKAVGLFYDQKTKRGIYGMADIDEFIAEAFSNPKFQALLKQVSAPKTPGSTLSSAWHWFSRIVRGILGLPMNTESALSRALEIGVGVMRENMRLSEAGGKTRYAIGQKQTDTEAFRKWFGDSKVVDANGEPMVVYHGTSESFDSFDATKDSSKTDHGFLGRGFYFSTSPDTAGSYANTKGGAGDPNVMPVFLSLQNPLRLRMNSKQTKIDLIRNTIGLQYNLSYEKVTPESAQQVTDKLRELGYDGVVLEYPDYNKNTWKPNGKVKETEIAVFDPTQIKSAIGNNGDFDGRNPDIRYNVADEGLSVSEWAKEVVMRLAGRPMADPSDPFAAENARLREQDQSLWSKAKKQLRRHLAPGGLLPQSVFAEKIKRDSEFQAVEFDVRHLIGGLEQAVKADFGMAFDKLSKEKMRPITEALAGNVTASLPEATKTAAVAMRQYIDGMSTEYLKIIQQKIDTKMLKAIGSGNDADKAQAINDIELFEKIKGNIGRYVHRSYQAFDDPKWFEKVPAPVLNASRLYLKQGYMESGETEAKAAQLAEVTLHEILKNGTAYDSMESFIAESKLGAKDLSVLMRRKEVPEQIRALLGEYPDARLNFTKSATKMGRLIWNTRFLDRVRDIGIGSFFFEGKDRPPAATTQIAADGSEVYAPLNGLWTFPEIAQSFKDALGKEQMSDLYRAIVRANGLVKYGKTVLAPTTAMRNWQSAMFFSLANGHFDLTQMKKSISAFREQVSQKATGQDLKYLRHLKQLGVVYDTPYAGEMARLMEDARMEELLSSDKGDAVRWFRKANQMAQGFYTFGDDFWKIIGFENEKSGLMKAGLTLHEAEIEAAKRIRDTYPTYSMVGRGVQWLSRFPLAGTFVSFPAEIIRTSSNMLRTVASDLKSDNPKLRELGMKRAAGMAFVSAAFWSLAALSKAMAGVDDDEEEAIRDMAPEWQKNSTFLFAGRDEKGNLRYFDMSFLDPYGYWKRPITAMMRDQPWEDSLASGLRGMLEPFLGADISAKAIFEAVSNSKDGGGKVYKDNDGLIDQAIDIADHLRKALQPGVAGNVERLIKASTDVRKSSGQPYSVEDELVALVGWRATTLDTKTALYYRSFEFTDAIAEARKTLTETLRDANTVSPEEIKDAKERASAKQREAFSEMSRLVGAAEAAGMSKMQIIQTLRLSNISQANVAALMRGATPGVTVTPQLASMAVRQARVMRGNEFANEVSDRYRQAIAN